MKLRKLALAGVKDCSHCRRAIAYLLAEDGEHTLGIALDAVRARDLSREPAIEGRERSLTGFFMQLLSSFSYVPKQVVLDFNDEDEFLLARVDLTTATFVCSPQEGVAFAAAAQIPLYANEEIFARRLGVQTPDHEEKGKAPCRTKPKTTIH